MKSLWMMSKRLGTWLSQRFTLLRNLITQVKCWWVVKGILQHFSYPNDQEFAQKLMRVCCGLTNWYLHCHPIRPSEYVHPRRASNAEREFIVKDVLAGLPGWEDHLAKERAAAETSQQS